MLKVPLHLTKTVLYPLFYVHSSLVSVIIEIPMFRTSLNTHRLFRIIV